MASASGYFDGTKNKDWFCRIEWSYTQAAVTHIYLTLKVYCGANSSYNNNPNSAYYSLQTSSKIYQTYDFPNSGWYTIASTDFTVGSAKTSQTVMGNFCTGQNTTYTPYAIGVSGTIEFPAIDTSKLYISKDLPELLVSDVSTHYDTLTVKAAGMTSGSTYLFTWYSKLRSESKFTLYRQESNTTGEDSSNGPVTDGKQVYCVVTSGGQSATTTTTVFRGGITAAIMNRKPVPVIYLPKIYNSAEWKTSIPQIKTDSKFINAFPKITQ